MTILSYTNYDTRLRAAMELGSLAVAKNPSASERKNKDEMKKAAALTFDVLHNTEKLGQAPFFTSAFYFSTVGDKKNGEATL